jgi:chemotaxis regulatin CheY-phosphate phosphatase CheZ
MPERAAKAPSPPLAPREERLNANYSGIEQVLSASARGRWFLAEHARRARAADTSALLAAIVKLELAVLRSQRKQSDHVFADLVEISEAIERTRREIAAIKPTDQLNAASTELDGIVAATETATSEILGAAEEVQEVGWILREKGAEPGLCDILDRRATDIYTACSFQDLTGQRTEKVVRVLRFIEERINAMIEIWGTGDIGFKMSALLDPPPEAPDLLNGAQARGAALVQGDVDAMLGSGAARAAPLEAEPGVTKGSRAPRSERPRQTPLSAALFG